MEGRKRQAGIELLRMVAMMMIVTMHFLANSGNLLEPGKPSDVSAVLGTILENFCLAAVNAYVFISGYFGYQGTFQVKRVLRFLCQIWFYSLLVPLVLMGLGISTGFQNGIYGILPYLFPIETEHYWFATSFLLLMLLMPFLNLAAQHLPKKTYQTALVVLFIFLSGIKSIVPVAFATDRYGYDLTWFVFVYLLAAYAGKYDENGIFHRFKTGRGNAAILFLLSAAAGMAIQFLMKDLGSFLPSLQNTCEYYFSVPYHYNTITVLTAAIGLFYLFRSLQIREGKAADLLRRLGGLCFGIYLLHEHIDIRGSWYGWLKALVNPAGNTGVLPFLTEWIFCLLVVCIAGLLTDLIRDKVFHLMGGRLDKTALGKWLKNPDDKESRGGNK